MLFSKEAWRGYFGVDCPDNLKHLQLEPRAGEMVFLDWDDTDLDFEGRYPDTGILSYCDANTGKELRQLIFQSDSFREEGGLGIPADFRLVSIVETDSQPIIYKHPVLPSVEIEAELLRVKNWRADRIGRKIHKDEYKESVVVFEDSWVPGSSRPREIACFLEERIFAEPGFGQNLWLEIARTIFFKNATFIYRRASPGLDRPDILVLESATYRSVPYGEGLFVPESLNPPLGIGKSRVVIFGS